MQYYSGTPTGNSRDLTAELTRLICSVQLEIPSRGIIRMKPNTSPADPLLDRSQALLVPPPYQEPPPPAGQHQKDKSLPAAIPPAASLTPTNSSVCKSPRSQFIQPFRSLDLNPFHRICATMRLPGIIMRIVLYCTYVLLRRVIRGPRLLPWSFTFELVHAIVFSGSRAVSDMRAYAHFGVKHMRRAINVGAGFFCAILYCQGYLGGKKVAEGCPVPAYWCMGRKPCVGYMHTKLRYSLPAIHQGFGRPPSPMVAARDPPTAGQHTVQTSIEEWPFPDSVIFFLHGGAFSLCSTKTHYAAIAGLSSAIGCQALSVDYRLAPESMWPAALEDALAAYQWLLGTGVLPQNIIVCGDSAGGNLALSLLAALRDAGIPLPSCAALFSPWVNLQNNAPSVTRNQKHDYIPLCFLNRAAEWYAGDKALDDPDVSPLFLDFTGFPPLHIQAGGEEQLLDDIIDLHNRALDAGVNSELMVFDGMPHVASMTLASPTFNPSCLQSFTATAHFAHCVWRGLENVPVESIGNLMV